MLKFSDQQVSYYDSGKDVVVWLTIPEYIKKFPDRISPHTIQYDICKSFILQNAIDIAPDLIQNERIAHANANTAYVFSLRSQGIVLHLPVSVKVSINIAWPKELRGKPIRKRKKQIAITGRILDLD